MIRDVLFCVISKEGTVVSLKSTQFLPGDPFGCDL